MKFGKRLLSQMTPAWSEAYFTYKRVKQALHLTDSTLRHTTFFDIVTSELISVNEFYKQQEHLYEEAMHEFCTKYFEELQGIVCFDKQSHRYEEMKVEFAIICGGIDALRKYAVLNYIALLKALKKHNKKCCSIWPVQDREQLVSQPFHNSSKMGALVAEAECIAVILEPDNSDEAHQKLQSHLTCPLCTRTLTMPVVLGCGHRFCWECLASAYASDSCLPLQSNSPQITTEIQRTKQTVHPTCVAPHHQCPVCHEELSLNPQDYAVDSVLQSFIDMTFGSSTPGSPNDTFDSQEQEKARLSEEICQHAAKLRNAFDVFSNRSSTDSEPSPHQEFTRERYANSFAHAIDSTSSLLNDSMITPNVLSNARLPVRPVLKRRRSDSFIDTAMEAKVWASSPIEIQPSTPSPTDEKSRRYECHVCGKRYIQNSHLTAHERTHYDERPFPCEEHGCSLAFFTKSALNNHKQVHTGEKPFQCHIDSCQRRFTTKSNLTRHLRAHYGIRPHACHYPNCGASFTTKSDLTSHIRIHTGERPFACDVTGCGQRFRRCSDLKAHLMAHTGDKPHPCPHCHKKFARPWALKAHLVTHKGISPYVCAVANCGKGYNTPWNLRRHQRKHSPEEIPKSQSYTAIESSEGFLYKNVF